MRSIYDARDAAARATSTASSRFPGSARRRAAAEPLELEVPFGAELVRYTVGPPRAPCPACQQGWGRSGAEYGRLPWPRLVRARAAPCPGRRRFPPEHADCLAMLAPVLTMDEGARIYAPGGEPARARGAARAARPRSRARVARWRGRRRRYSGTIGRGAARARRRARRARHRADLLAYEPRWSDPVECAVARHALRSRGAGSHACPRRSPGCRPLRGLAAPERALALVDALRPGPGGGTHDEHRRRRRRRATRAS